MNKLFLKAALISAALTVATLCSAAETDSLRVLWIGNSFTYVNDLPAMVRDIASTQGMKLSMTKVTKGGECLRGHWGNPRLQELLKRGGWDYVIVQDQSTDPAQSTAAVARKVYPYAKKIDSLAVAHSPNAKVIFYMTWGAKYGSIYKTDYVIADYYETMQERLKTSYLEMAHDNNAWCAPVGMAWQTVRREHPEYQLYGQDCSHPSLAGSYLAANVIFTTIMQKPYQTKETRGLPAEQAEILQQAAQNTVLGNLRLLNIKKD